MNLKDVVIVLCIVMVMSIFSNVLATPVGIVDSIPGLLILAAIAFIGIALSKVLPGNIPAVVYVVTLGCILTYPAVPGSAFVNEYVQKIGFVSLCTPILAYAGVAIGKDLDDFAKSGWRIVVVACVVFTGTYIGSAVIAQFVLEYLGQI